MKWDTLRADKYCIAVKDGTHDTPKQVDFGYKLVTGKHIKNGQIDSSSAYYISEDDYNAINRRSLVEQWDVIMSMIGTVGEAAVVKNNPDYAIKNVALFKCGGSEIRGKWLCYYLNSPEGKGRMLGEMKGSSQQFLSLKQLRELPIMFSEEKVPRIVEMISNYDDLIENNQKQIKLLEEAAQRLYKEWFVDLRFPGHENTKIVDGVPEGWSKSTVGNICKLRKVVITPDKIESNTPYIGLEHMPRNDICLSTWGKSEEINSNKFIYLKKDVLFGKIRPYFHKVGFALNDGITSTDTMVMVADQNLWGLLLVTVSSDAFVDFSYQNCKEGAKMPRADWKQMEKYAIMIADQATQKLFEQEILVITNKISALAFQCRSLREARDRMLPKLMGGEVEA